MVQTTATPGFGDYAYDGSGNIIQAGPRTYRYDELGRLSSVTNGAAPESSYTYDRHGNLLTISTTSVNASNVTTTSTTRLGVDAKTNRMDQNSTNGVANNMVAGYDTYGNVTWSPTGSFVYDQFRMPTESTVGGLRTLYLYSASDERIASIHPAYAKEFWTIRDPGGRVLRRMDRTAGTWSWSQDYIYGAGRLIAAEIPGPAKTLHYHADHLGTPRLITGNGGAQVGRHDYYPYGLEIAGGTNDGERLKFTSHERDAATLDYMHARYYDPSMARFLSVDPGKDWDPRQPQSWNVYAYGRNNPVLNVDADGRSARNALKYLYQAVSGKYKEITRAQAVRAAARGEKHRVKIQGSEGVVREARSVAKDAFPGEKILHHDAHPGGGERLPHFQPAGAGLNGQVGYEIVKALVSMIPIIGVAFDADAANGPSEVAYGARFAARAQAMYGNTADLTLEQQHAVVVSLQENPEGVPARTMDDLPPEPRE
jgi:RHS repeat-associated protein